MNAYANKNTGKLLAAIMVFAMIVCAFSVVMPEVSADEAADTANANAPEISFPTGTAGEDYTVIDDFSDFPTKPGVYVINVPTDEAKTITIDEDLTIGAGQTLYIGEKYDANTTNKLTIKSDADVTVTIAGTIYNNLATNMTGADLAFDGKVVFTGSGVLYSTSAMAESTTRTVTGFYTTSDNSNLFDNPTVYRQVYGANINTVMSYVDADATYKGESLTTGGKYIIAYGDAQISGSVTLSANLVLGGTSSSTLTVNNGATLTVPADYTVANGASSNKTVVNNGKFIVADAKDFTATISPMSTGTITATTTTDAYLGGTIDKSTVQTNFGSGTTVNVIDDLVIDGAQITINGTMIVPEDFTVTIINEGSLTINSITGVLENNGEIIVETDDKNGKLVIASGASVNKAGTISFMCDSESDTTNSSSVAGTINNTGAIYVTDGDNNILTVTGAINNKADGTINFEGTVDAASATIYNTGTITVDGVVNATVSMSGENAQINITTVAGNFLVNDTAFTDKNLKNSDATNYVAVTTNTDDSPAAVTGLTIKSTVTEKSVSGETLKYKTLDIAGDIGVDTEVEKPSNEIASVRMYGPNIAITGTLSYGAEGFGMYFGGADTVITVSGTMEVGKDSTKNPDGTVDIYVTGSIVSEEELDMLEIRAGYYETTGTNATYNYSIASAAINAASQAGINRVYILGDVELTENVTVGDKMIVYVQPYTSEEFTVGKDVTLTIANGGRIDNSGTVDVDGTLTAEVERTGIRGNGAIISDVVSRGETSVTYTNLANAIALAGSTTTTISLNGDVKIESNLTIPANVTVDTNSNGFEVAGATLTINGTLYLNNTAISSTPGTGYYCVHDVSVGNLPKDGSVVLNGYIMSNGEMNYNDVANGTGDDAGKMFPAGAYYSAMVENVTYNYITPVANSPSITASAVNGEIAIYGENTVGDLSYTGTADDSIIITIYGKLTAGTITIDETTLVFENQEFDGTVASANGSIEFTDAVVDGEIANVTADDVKEFTITGLVGAATENNTPVETYSVVFDGVAFINNLDVDGITVNGEVTVTGTGSDLGKSVVNGTLTVDNNSTFTADEVIVLGTLNVAVATENDAAGSAKITTMYVGISKDSKGKLGEAVAATVSGEVSADITYVSASATVPEDITEGTAVKSTEFYVEDSLWMTVYTVNKTASVGNAPVVDAEFKGWNDSEGELKYAENSSTGVGMYTEITVGTPEKLYADINYNVYTIHVYVDNGIGSVAVDGNILTQGTNYFYNATGLTAGEHTISYTLKNGYQGDVKMTIDGVTSDGHTFTLSGDYAGVENIVIINLAGTEPATGGSTVIDNGDDGMGLTDYLLIILVVLIVIMAIMVAMRLMRS